jgi:hypothetical protein
LGETLWWVRLFTVGMTQPGNDKHMQTYSLGETIRLELDLLDRSGVLTVNAAFYETESDHGFSMRGDGGGRSKVTVVLTHKVTDKTLPGEYRCKDVTVYDTHHNYATYTPDIRFRIETPWGTMRGRSSWTGEYPSSKLTFLGGYSIHELPDACRDSFSVLLPSRSRHRTQTPVETTRNGNKNPLYAGELGARSAGLEPATY